MCIFASHFEREGVTLVGFGIAQWLECQVCRFCRGCRRKGHPFFFNYLIFNTMKKFRILFYDYQDILICCHWKECDNIWNAIEYISEIYKWYDNRVKVVVVETEDVI